MAAPKLNRRRAVFVLAKIDEILVWEQGMDRERDTRFVDLGRYLCEVRSGQYWRLERRIRPVNPPSAVQRSNR
jgi:hypothetical protein